MSRICAVVLDYFGVAQTERCLKSLVGQGLAEVWVVDNSGDPGHQALLSERVHVLATMVDFDLRYMVNDDNLGFGKAINRALSLPSEDARCDFYLIINNDAQAEHGMVVAMEHALRVHPDAGIVAPWTEGGGERFCGFWYQRYLGLITKQRLPGSFHYLGGSCLLIDAKLAGTAALFDAAFFMYGEDVELGWRLRQQGFRPRCVPGTTLRHVGVGSSRQGGLFYEYHVTRGHVLLAARLSTAIIDQPLMWFGRLIALPLRALVRCVRFRTLWPMVALGLAWLPWQVDLRPKKSR